FNSLVNDHKQWGLDTDTIIEMKASSINTVYLCIATVLLERFDIARAKYHQQIRTPLSYYQPIINELLSRGEIKNIIDFSLLNFKRHGMFPLFFFGPLLAIFHNVINRSKSILTAINNRINR
ncbi:MAG: hypothetical protein QNK40_01200, partial [Desulfobacterales bacterium]|nr:hypothetical protein [Desulfobacterales bacterium]